MPMSEQRDPAQATLVVYAARHDGGRWWCEAYGEVDIPSGWEFLESGDAFLTRQVEAAGPHWVAVGRTKRRRWTLGVWAPAAHIVAARAQAAATVTSREARRVVGRRQRERQEAKYRDQFADAVAAYLGFAPEYQELAHTIAREVTPHATEVGSGRVGRARKLTLEEKVADATRAHLRHRYTSYDDQRASSATLRATTRSTTTSREPPTTP